MAIAATRRKNYGGTAVTQKYSPLEDIKYKRTQAAEYTAILNNRLLQLANANILPQPLILVTDWASVLPTGAGTDPPLVVISNNRSKWIAMGVRLATEQHKISEYEGSSDLNALTGLVAKQAQSPPLYAPPRAEGDRKVFVLVHMHEYHQYRTALADSRVTVVGWSFRTVKTAPGPLTGFGASRYAAIEFCKHVREKMTGTKWDYAWLFDDNVVGMTNFPGFTAVEDAIKAATTAQVCAAFQGGAGVESFTSIRDWASALVNATPTRAKPTGLPDAEEPRLIIQQAALWNIKYLSDHKLNFAPLFVASGEDVSLGNYFNSDIPSKPPRPKEDEPPIVPAKPPIPYLYYGGITVKKEVVNYTDDSHGAKLVNKARDDYARWFAAEEARGTIAGSTAPPPVAVESAYTRFPGVRKLSDFITSWFTDTDESQRPPVAATDAMVQDKAKCHAVEQILCGAIKTNWLDPEVLSRTFKVRGEHGQVILQHPPPRIRT